MPYGYQGRLLQVDLSSRRFWVEELPEQLARDFVGGVGLVTRLLYEAAPPHCDPLSPDNPLIFATSPLVGTPVTTSAKYALAAKSPLTGFIGDSLSGGSFAVELKKTGADALVVRGAAPELICLLVEDGQVRFLPAGHLAGKGISETEEQVRQELGSDLRVAAIGPAGENLVRYAAVGSDGRHAGRTGNGAVMGAKKLKAIAVRGSKPVKVARPGALTAVSQRLAERSSGPATARYRWLGTPANLLAFHHLAVLPSYNFRLSTFEGAERLSGEELHRHHLATVTACVSCNIGCTHFYRALDGRSSVASERVEYETLFALGPLLGIDDPNLVIRAAALCDQLGLDSISTGGTLAWAMECFERGLLSPGETDGLDLRFGNGAALLPAIQKIARREGIGDLLAEGSKRAAERLGRGSQEWAMQVKGLEMPGYEPRGLKTLALGLAVSTRGACHNRSAAYEADLCQMVDRFKADEGRGQLVAAGEDLEAVLDSLILCKFIRGCFADIYSEAAEIYNLVTGFDLTADGLRQAGERIVNLKKAFNIREGWRRQDDTLPPRILGERLPSSMGESVGLTSAELDLMVAAYYRARGWTANGLIPEAKLRELRLWELMEAKMTGATRSCQSGGRWFRG